MSTPKKRLLIVDAHALIHRAFHAIPPLTTKKGQQVNAAYGFLLILIRALKDLKPTHVVIAFDSPGKTFRHDVFPDYKANRDAPAEELVSQFPIVHEIADEFGFSNFSQKGYEADDIIGTICAKLDGTGVETIIATGDMDLSQLIDDDTKLLKPHKGIKETVLFDADALMEKLGVTPEQVTDYKGLRGDPSDNIPGVRGIGEKGAMQLLQEFGDIDGIYDNVEKVTGRNRKPLDGSREDAVLSKQLATIATDAPIDFTLEDSALGSYDQSRIQKLVQKYEFTSLLAQINSLPGFEVEEGLFAKPADKEAEKKRRAEFDYVLVDDEAKLKKLVHELSQQKIFAFDTETEGLNPLLDPLVGISVSFKDKTGYYVPCPDGTVPKSLASIFENPDIGKTAHNAKFDIKVLHHAGVRVEGLAFDSMVASFILNSGSRGHGLDHLAFTECGHEMQSITELIGKGKSQITMSQVPVEDASWYACEDADFTWRLYTIFSERLKKEKMQELFDRFELPTIEVLASVEETGVRIDEDFLADMSKKLHKRITTLEKNIQKEAGVEFNVASSTQMRGVLYDTMGLPTEGIKKGKTGYSTAASELEKLRDAHAIIPMIEEFRELSKLTSTYIDSLPKLVNPETKRIHTSYSQTIAATGRLSSNDPNLQNIPIRTELGREIRKAFVAGRGKRIVALDYSQIELRVVAHLSGDRMMTEAFAAGADIHTRTAAALNEVHESDVTKDMRRNAKAINFGILYGMGVQGIQRDSGVSRDEARTFLDKYFEVHSGIQDYIEKIKEQTRQNGYAETLFGRRRPLPDINSSSRLVASAAERAAVNMPVQGTAADIMKLAMIEVARAIDAGKIKATMLLQVHDELVFEIHAGNAADEAKKIRTIMEGIVELDVPLVVDVESGMNWGELK
jgi:DNA polymerase-1